METEVERDVPELPADRMVVDGVDVLGSLSPSRAGDFLTCPLRYRFRTIDRLPEPSSPDAVRGTVVHKVLEELFDLPAAARTPGRAAELLQPAWETVLELEPEVAEMFGPEGPEIGAWLASCREALERYFTLEDPTRLEPAERELYVESLWTPGCCCVVSSTGSTSPRPARSASWTTRPAAPRTRRSRHGRCSR